MGRLLRRGGSGLATIVLLVSPAAAVTVEQFSPQGTVKEVRQVTARFSAAMVPFGDLRDRAAPFAIDCAEAGTARWIDSRTWAYDFQRDLPAGVRCTFTAREGLRSLAGEALRGQKAFAFSTGGPAIESTEPGEGSDRIEEQQTFVVALNGEATRDSVLAHAAFEVEGLPERVGVTLVEGAERDQLIANLPYWLRPQEPMVVLTARQAFPHKAKVRLIWGAGIASPTGVRTEQDQVLEYRVRPPFTAKVSCERENPKAHCVPLAPVQIAFSAPVAWDQAREVRLVDAGGGREPKAPEDPVEFVTSIEFPPPFPESATYTVAFPTGLRDDAGRPLANRDATTLTVQTSPYPPLAKFAARFGILEAHADPALPVTIRNLDPVVEGRRLTVASEPAGPGPLADLYARLTGTVTRVGPEHPEQILPWLIRLATARRATSMFAGVTPPEGQQITTFTLPQPDGPGAFQVVGIPFESPGFYLVELASPRLGAALLGTNQPMYVPAGALVTNLSVHLQWAHESALVWVTTLDRAAPVAGARIAVQDCTGTVLATAETDANGLAPLSGLPDEERVARCHRDDMFAGFDGLDYRDYYAATALNELGSGLLVTARTDGDFSFVHSSWADGIEPWRFQLPSERWQAPVTVHTILDRPLFRQGDTVHMKHVLRHETMDGFGFVPPERRPTTAVIRHLGSNETFELPLTWDDAGLAEQAWPIPPGAKLGQYDISLTLKDQQWGSGGFRIEQFRVPLMKATVQLPAEPQIGVTAIPVDIAVQYLAGGPAAEMPVVLRAQIRDRAPPGLPDYEHATFANGPVKAGIVRESDVEEQEPAGAQTPGIHQRQTVTLDAAGAARTEITEIPPVAGVREVLAEIEYRDPNGETQTAAGAVPVWPAALLPGIEAQHWAGTTDSIAAQVVVIDSHLRPAAGAPVTVDVFQRRYYSHRKRLVGGFYAYEHVEETRPLAQLCAGTTNADGVLRCTGTPPADGELILQATVTDPAGDTAAAHESVYVRGEDDWAFAVAASDRIDVVPERREYEPGETARFQIRMPFTRATALVTVQREGVTAPQVLEISAQNPVVEVPVSGEYAPNAFVSVFVVRGRVGDVQPTALLDLGKPAFKLGIAEIRVGWRAHRLRVDVTPDRSTYRVREKAKVRIAVRGEDGAPLAPGSEVAVAAVDEGLLELLPNTSWNLLEAMMGRRGYGVRTATGQLEVIGKRHFGRKALPTGGGGGRQSTRELFDTLLLWQGRVPLAADGTATVEIPLNDSLTSFRIAAVGTSGVGRFGTGFAEIRSTQDIMLLSGLPPVVREGDRLPAQFTLRNTTDSTQQLEVRCRVEGLADTLAAQTLPLEPGASRIVSWPIAVPPGADRLRYTVEASAAGGPSDRLVVTQRVLPSVPVRTLQATLARWERPLRVPVERPSDALPERGGIDVAAAASIAGSLEPLRDWLRAYPYTCLEQMVSIAVGLDDAARWQSITAALPSYLDADGLLKYFPTIPLGSDVLTAYVLTVSQANGWTLPPAVQEKLVGGLRAFVDGSLRRESPLNAPDLVLRKLAAVAALARVGSADAQLLESIRIEPNLWPTSGVLDWWSILQRLDTLPNRAARLSAAEQIVRARLNLQGTTMGFSTERTDALYWLMTTADVNALRLIAHLVEFNLWRDDLPRLVRGAVARQERGIWDTTVADAWGSVALRRFAAAFEATPVTGTTSVSLDDATESMQWTAPPGPVDLPWPPRPAELVVDHAGTGNPWITVSSRAAIPLTAPLGSGYRIEKTITPLEPRTPGRMSVGDKLHVRLEIEAQSDMTWVVVDDPIPAGASHLGTGLARDTQIDAGGEAEDVLTPAFAERRFEAYRAYYDFVEKGRFVAEYTIRLNQSGRFELPPTRVEALYAPEMFGEIPNAAIEVTP